MPTDCSGHSHPPGRPWKAQISRVVNTAKGRKQKTIYLGMWASKVMATEAEEAYVRAHMPDRGDWRLQWDAETETMNIYTRNNNETDY